MISHSPWLLLAVAVTLYSASIIVYRLFFHPLARFPGPKLSAATRWYEAYFDVLKWPGGYFMFEMQRMHRYYGPIVRITPDELHICDSTWIHELYVNPTEGVRDKFLPAADVAGVPESIFSTASAELHRRRRLAISSFFSKRSVAAFEASIYHNIQLMLRNVARQTAQDGIAEMRTNYLAFTTDTVTGLCFRRPLGLLKDNEQAVAWRETTAAVASLTPLAKQFRWMVPVALQIPMFVLEGLVPSLSRIVKLRHDMNAAARHAIEEHEATRRTDNSGNEAHAGNRADIFQKILSNGALSPFDKTVDRLAQEGFHAITAGSETTARVLATATYFVLANKPVVMPRLQDELRSVMPYPDSKPPIRDLEQLQWLRAIVKESLRLTALVTSRLPVISPKEPLYYHGSIIPAGTPISVSLRDVLLDENIYSDPMEFRPERWLSDNPELERMSQFWVPFSRGSRMCLGINLALGELYIALASTFRRFPDMELFETLRERDIDVSHDYFLGEASASSQGVRVKAKEACPS